MCCSADTDRAIRDAGLRRTSPRSAVAVALRHAGGHRTADEVLARLREEPDGEAVARSTVYRALESLEAAGLVHGVRSPQSEMRFEWSDDSDHHHLTCDVCGHESEVALTSVRTLQREVRQAAGFDVSIRHLALRGRCAGCREEREGAAR
ncbi:MAG: hypothetical protein AMXMBFR23_05870 [Chloroflexota bacterium]